MNGSEVMAKNIDILTLGLRECWNMYRVMTERDSQYEKVRFGLNKRFDINNAIKGNYTVKEKTGIVMINSHTMDQEVFETELEDRERIMKNWLEENFEEEKVMSPRGEN